MRLLILVLTLVLAGCIDMPGEDAPASTVSWEAATLFDERVQIPPGESSAEVAVDVPRGAQAVQVVATADGSTVNLRIVGCEGPTGSGNIQVAVEGTQRADAECGDVPPGTLRFAIERDAGAGDVGVVVTGRVPMG